MELYIDRDELVRTLARVQSIVERRSTHPSLSHVLLRARPDGLQLTATDTEIAFLGRLVANVVEPGENTVEAASLFQIARALPESTVHLKVGAGHRLEVRCAQTFFRIPGLPAEEYPNLPAFEARGTMTVAAGTLRRVIEQVAFAVSQDEARYGLNGVHVERLDGGETPRMRLVATDGHRLSSSSAAYEGELAMPARMLLPRKALATLLKLLDLDDQPVVWSFSDSAVQVRLGEQTLWFRLLEGEFPDYRAVIPTSHKTRATVRRDLFGSALKRVGILASDKTRSVRFTFSEEGLEMRVQNVDRGEAREVLQTELEGGSVELGFNVRYFQDILGVLRDELVVIDLGDPLSPCLVHGAEDSEAEFVIMPMRLD